MIVRFPCNIHVSESESQKIIFTRAKCQYRRKLALCAPESGYMSHGSTKLSKVLTLSGLSAPIPLTRNKVAIIYTYGNFLTKKYLIFQNKINTFARNQKKITMTRQVITTLTAKGDILKVWNDKKSTIWYRYKEKENENK